MKVGFSIVATVTLRNAQQVTKTEVVRTNPHDVLRSEQTIFIRTKLIEVDRKLFTNRFASKVRLQTVLSSG